MSTSPPIFPARIPRFSFDADVILPVATRIQIDECLAKIQYRKQIYDDWNFKSVDPMGNNTVLNFYGPPGTGKTLAAEAFADLVKRPIIHIGIADLESSFMGETARNLQAAFRAAIEASAVLFFDEADTLLGARLSSVTQGVDSEINAMRSTLLIELPRHEGIVIFATNFAHNYDDAYRGRITHHVRFDMPNAECRARIWDRMFIPSLPLPEDRQELIRNCAELSDGFSGRDILTCMRLALPKMLRTATQDGTVPQLKLIYLEESLAQINRAKEEVGKQAANDKTRSNGSLVSRLLGIKQPPTGD